MAQSYKILADGTSKNDDNITLMANTKKGGSMKPSPVVPEG